MKARDRIIVDAAKKIAEEIEQALEEKGD